MSGFNKVEYDAGNKVAVVGTGMRWGEVYRSLDQYNVTVVGGRILDVGVGGLLLGSMCLLIPSLVQKGNSC
jgi:FAD/FMN-containing dehydrogenase